MTCWKAFSAAAVALLLAYGLPPASAQSARHETELVPRVVIPQSNGRWFQIPLIHSKASAIIEEMHWGDRVPFGCFLSLPAGVEEVFAGPKANSLLLFATVDGFAEARRIVQLLDIPGYTFAPTLTFLHVPAGDPHLKWRNAQAQGLEISAGADAAEAFREITAAGAKTKTITVSGWYRDNACDLDVSNPRLRGGGSLTLDFTTGCWDGVPIEVPGIHSGSVLAVREQGTHQVTLILVSY